jgi:hypothetical protein
MPKLPWKSGKSNVNFDLNNATINIKENVSLNECKVACENDTRCKSVQYSELTKKCKLTSSEDATIDGSCTYSIYEKNKNNSSEWIRYGYECINTTNNYESMGSGMKTLDECKRSCNNNTRKCDSIQYLKNGEEKDVNTCILEFHPNYKVSDICSPTTDKCSYQSYIPNK